MDPLAFRGLTSSLPLSTCLGEVLPNLLATICPPAYTMNDPRTAIPHLLTCCVRQGSIHHPERCLYRRPLESAPVNNSNQKLTTSGKGDNPTLDLEIHGTARSLLCLKSTVLRKG